jgi:hypothetical protein
MLAEAWGVRLASLHNNVKGDAMAILALKSLASGNATTLSSTNNSRIDAAS